MKEIDQNTIYIKLIDLYIYFKKIPDKLRIPHNFIIYLHRKYGINISSTTNKIKINLDIGNDRIIPYLFQYNKYSNRVNYEITYNYYSPGGKIYNISGVSSIDKRIFIPLNNKEIWIGTFGTKLKSTKISLENSNITREKFASEIKSKIGHNGFVYIGRITLFLNGCIGTQVVKLEDSSAGECLTDSNFSDSTNEFIELLPLRLMIGKESIYSNLIIGKLMQQNKNTYNCAIKIINEIGKLKYSEITKMLNHSDIIKYNDILVHQLVKEYISKNNKYHDICIVIYNIEKYINQKIIKMNLSDFKKFYIILDRHNMDLLYSLIIK